KLTNELLDAAQARGRMDLVREYALPIPTTIIAEMLGVPPGDRDRFHRWSNAVLSAAASSWRMFWSVPNGIALIRYMRKIIRKRRADPQDDLVTALIRVEEAGDKLSEDELAAMMMLLLVAGHETTVNLIANGVLSLLEHSDQMEKLRSEPALIKTAVEEMLRFYSPVEIATERYAREDLAVAGLIIPRGELVYVLLGSATRDGRYFPDPEKFDITREPNKHLAFGLGTHFCLGASLARLEAQVAINTLLRRAPGLRLAVRRETLRWRRGLLLRGLRA